ncbi:oligosaccharyl transferase, archaeosortase A system-associated, partial [Candidatus Bathyarchaeota archaeon]|nr:oligosaccharyl transferase, archaeosortase A system-associated [Candidatus Bathyarchaeota archaeon]
MNVQMLLEKNKIKLLLFTMLLALVVRISVLPYVFSNGSITFLGADTYYHVRRILFTASHFPNTLNFDIYVDFPYGTKIGWMPLYDQFVALIALIAGLGKPSLFTIEATAAIVPPLLGVMTVLLVFFTAEKIFDWRAGLFSAGIFAITPAHVYVSFLGYADHHVAETFLSTTAYLFFIIALKRLQKENISIDPKTKLSKILSFPILTGITLAISILTWNGAPIFVGLIGVFIIVQFVLDKMSGRNSDYLVITGGIAYFVSFLIITPVALIKGMGFEYNSYSPSLFHSGFLAVFVSLCIMLALIQKIHFKKWWYYPLLLILMFEATLYSLGSLYPQFYQSAMSGVGYIFGEGVSMVQEAQPLFTDPGTGFTLDHVWNDFSVSFFIALISILFITREALKDKYNFKYVFFIIWTLIVLTLTIFQRRFIYLLAVNVAILSGYFVVNTMNFFSPKPDNKKITSNIRRKASRISDPKFNKGLILGILMIAIIAIPDIIIIKSMATDDIPAPPSDLQESFKWLKNNSLPTSYYDNPDKTPEYGVMSFWDNGNWILYFSQRPVVTNNFQAGLGDAVRFLIEPDEKIANEVLNQ